MDKSIDFPDAANATEAQTIEPEELAIIACFARQRSAGQMLPLLTVQQLLSSCNAARHVVIKGIERLETRAWLFRAFGGYPEDQETCVLLGRGAMLALAHASALRRVKGNGHNHDDGPAQLTPNDPEDNQSM
jgi:hypothetical protein